MLLRRHRGRYNCPLRSGRAPSETLRTLTTMSGVAPQEGVSSYFIYKPVHGAASQLCRLLMDEADSCTVRSIRCPVCYFRLRPHLAKQFEVSLLQNRILAPLVGVKDWAQARQIPMSLTLQGIPHLHGRVHPSRIWVVRHRQSRHIYSLTSATVCRSTRV